MPIPRGLTPEPSPELTPDVAYGAGKRLSSMKAGKDIPPGSLLAQKDDTRGYLHSFLNATPLVPGGIPTNAEEAKHGIIQMLAPWLGPAQNLWGMVKDPSFQNINRNLNPLAAPMEQMGGGNVAGGLGSATPFLVGSLAAGAGLRPPQSPASPPAGGINLLNPRPSTPGPPTTPIYGPPTEVPASPMSRLGEYGIREMVGKIPILGTKISDALKGSIAKPKTVSGAKIGQAIKPRTAVGPPEFAPFEDSFPLPNKPATNNPKGLKFAGGEREGMAYPFQSTDELNAILNSSTNKWMQSQPEPPQPSGHFAGGPGGGPVNAPTEIFPGGDMPTVALSKTNKVFGSVPESGDNGFVRASKETASPGFQVGDTLASDNSGPLGTVVAVSPDGYWVQTPFGGMISVRIKK